MKGAARIRPHPSSEGLGRASCVLIVVQNLGWSHQERAHLGVCEWLPGTSTTAPERAGA